MSQPLSFAGFRASASVAALLAAAPALAADLEAKSRIEAVTVYPDAAAVTRFVEIDLPAGATSLIFRNLPGAIDPSSLRVEGAATGRLAIGAVDVKASPVEPVPADTAIDSKLKALRGEREGVQSAIEALEAKKAMISRFGQAGPEKLSPEAAPLDIDKWAGAWDAVGKGLKQVGEDLGAARASARDLADQIRTLDQARQRPRPVAGPHRDVAVALEAGAAIKGSIRLTYRVAGAGWQPLYDAMLETGGVGKKPALEFVRRASITQRTGEDWTGVALSVSTVRAQRGVQPPDIDTQRLAFWEPVPARPVARGQLQKNEMADQRVRENVPASVAAAPAPAPMQAAQEQQADIQGGAYQASFRIPGTVDIPADGAAKNVRIGSRSLDVDLTARTVPALDQTAYLTARVVNDEEAPILPGEVSIHRDGMFVGRGRLAFTAPGDGVDLAFGADDRIKVARAPVNRKENEPTWFGQTKTETREFKTSVRNLHDFPVKVNVVDRIPISENSAIVIEQLPATTPPTDKIVADKRGVMGWTLSLAPNESKDVRLAYRMKWPADRDVVFQNAPNPKGPALTQ